MKGGIKQFERKGSNLFTEELITEIKNYLFYETQAIQEIREQAKERN